MVGALVLGVDFSCFEVLDDGVVTMGWGDRRGGALSWLVRFTWMNCYIYCFALMGRRVVREFWVVWSTWKLWMWYDWIALLLRGFNNFVNLTLWSICSLLLWAYTITQAAIWYVALGCNLLVLVQAILTWIIFGVQLVLIVKLEAVVYKILIFNTLILDRIFL